MPSSNQYSFPNNSIEDNKEPVLLFQYGSNNSLKNMIDRVPKALKEYTTLFDFFDGKTKLEDAKADLLNLKIDDSFTENAKNYVENKNNWDYYTKESNNLNEKIDEFLGRVDLNREKVEGLLNNINEYTNSLTSSRKRAILDEYHLVINKMAQSDPKNKGFANIVQTSPEVIDSIKTGKLVGVLLPWVEGVVYQVPKSYLGVVELTEGIPKKKSHYYESEVEINIDNKKYNALTFIANDERTGLGLRPTESYKSLILDGSEFFSSEYQKEVENFPTFESKISQKNATTKELNQIVSFLNVC